MKLFSRKKGGNTMLPTDEDIKATVRSRYGAFAAAGGTAETCCAALAPDENDSYAVDHGLYTDAELNTVPPTARRLSRGCGNPVGFAGLHSGQTVTDFGCGGGIDVVMASRQVGRSGRVIGVDMTPEMIERARESVTEAELSEEQVDFVVTDMAKSGLPDASVDVVISNCVINLAPDKTAVYREIFRVLRPGGRLAISDIVLNEPIASEVTVRFRADWPGCLGGAIPEDDYLQIVASAGFPNPTILARHPLGPGELIAMSCCPGEKYTPTPSFQDLAAVQNKVVSIKFTATKQ